MFWCLELGFLFQRRTISQTASNSKPLVTIEDGDVLPDVDGLKGSSQLILVLLAAHSTFKSNWLNELTWEIVVFSTSKETNKQIKQNKIKKMAGHVPYYCAQTTNISEPVVALSELPINRVRKKCCSAYVNLELCLSLFWWTLLL